MLEDIQARLAEDLAEVERNLATFANKHQSPETSPLTSDFRKLQAIHNACEQMLADVDRLLEIATDPNIDAVYELRKIRLELPTLRKRSEMLEEERELRRSAEKRADGAEQELFKRKQKKHYIKGTDEKRFKKLGKKSSKG